MEIVPAIPEDNYIKVNLSDGLVLAAQQNVDDTGIILVPDPTLDQSSYVEVEHPNDEFANKFYIDCSELNITQQRSIDHIEVTSMRTGQRIMYIDNLENSFYEINYGEYYEYTIQGETQIGLLIYYTINTITYMHFEIVANTSSGQRIYRFQNNIQTGLKCYIGLTPLSISDYNEFKYFLVEYCHYILGSREKLYMLNKQKYLERSSNSSIDISDIESLGFPNNDYTFEDMHIKGVPTS